jgi:ribonucleotide reductase alpha subunit
MLWGGYGGFQEVQIWNGFAWSYVTPMVTGENQEIYDLEFSDGTKLSCTPYHKFVLADNSRIEAKDLQLSDKLAKHRFPIIEGGIRLDNRVAYTQGFYSGDGQAGTNSIWLYNEKCDLLHYLAASAFSDQSTDIVKRFQVSTEFRVESKDFVPDVNFSISTRISWLAGLIDSDGSSQSKTVTIWSVDRNFLNKVKLMMNTLGATGKITLGKRAGMKFMPNSHGGQSLYECQDCWRISISGYYIELLKNLGLRTNRVDISSVVETESNRFIQLTFKHKRIQLEPKVYCFTEELNHTGIFNGIMTAQCGEQPLPPYGCCDLGPINLTKFVMFPFTQEAYFDYDKFKSAVAIQVRFLDNVLDTTLWPLEQQRIEAMNKRRIGLGFTGLGNTLAMMNLHYDSGYGRNLAKNIATCMRDTAYNASIDLAIEKGEFPLLEKEKYLTDTFASRLPDHIKDRIRTYGIRNSHLLSIAPTGTVSLAFCDNASNGIEPPYSLAYTRKKRENDGTMKEYPVIDYGFRLWLETQEPNEAKQILDAVCNYRDHILVGEDNKKVLLKELLPVSLVTALELSVDAHLQMLKVVQPYIDTSISKTTNVPVDYPFEDFKTIYDKAWEYKLKGVATYRPNDILGSVLSVPVETKKEVKVEEPKKDTKPVDPFTVAYPRRPLGDFKSITRKIVYTGATGDVSLFLTVSFIDTYGWTDTDTLIVERPLEVFIVVPPDDVPVEWVTAYAKNLSLIARSSLPLLVKALQDGRSIKSDKGQIRYGWFNKDDGSRAPRFHNSEVGVIAYAIQELLQSKNILDTDGNLLPLNDSNIVNFIASEEPTDSKKEPSKTPEPKSTNGNSVIRTNKVCKHCGASAVIKRDGCSFCTNCNMPGDCG